MRQNRHKSIEYIQKVNARVWMVRLVCGGRGDGEYRSTRSFIKFHGADGVRMREREEEVNIVPRGLDIKFHGADGTGRRMGGWRQMVVTMRMRKRTGLFTADQNGDGCRIRNCCLHPRTSTVRERG